MLVCHISTVLYLFYYVSIFQIISYLTTSPTHTWKATLYLPFPIPFQMYLSPVRVRRMPPFDASASHFNCTSLVLFVSIFQIISYLTTSPTHTWKATLYLPFPIPFQMYLSPVRVRCMPPFDASASHFNCTLLVLLCKYLSKYFLLNHFTHPHLESNLVLTLSYSISDVLVSH